MKESVSATKAESRHEWNTCILHVANPSTIFFPTLNIFLCYLMLRNTLNVTLSVAEWCWNYPHLIRRLAYRLEYILLLTSRCFFPEFLYKLKTNYSSCSYILEKKPPGLSSVNILSFILGTQLNQRDCQQRSLQPGHRPCFPQPLGTAAAQATGYTETFVFVVNTTL